VEPKAQIALLIVNAIEKQGKSDVNQKAGAVYPA
jgi:hypothetical protein